VVEIEIVGELAKIIDECLVVGGRLDDCQSVALRRRYGCVFDQLESGLKCVIRDAIATVAFPRFFS
jgi:hypothetical protein